MRRAEVGVESTEGREEQAVLADRLCNPRIGQQDRGADAERADEQSRRHEGAAGTPEGDLRRAAGEPTVGRDGLGCQYS